MSCLQRATLSQHKQASKASVFLYNVGDIYLMTKHKSWEMEKVLLDHLIHHPAGVQLYSLGSIYYWAVGQTGVVYLGCYGWVPARLCRWELYMPVPWPAQVAATGFCSKRTKSFRLDILCVLGAFLLTCWDSGCAGISSSFFSVLGISLFYLIFMMELVVWELIIIAKEVFW